MVAPYWNTEASRGDVCEGDMPRPQETDVTNILEWEEGFFNSRFTHPSGIGKLTAHSGGFIGLWTELAGTAQFPTRYLVEQSRTSPVVKPGPHKSGSPASVENPGSSRSV